MRINSYKLVIVGFLSLLVYSCTGKLKESLNENYKEAILNEGTFSYFTVVRVKNRNTGETRELATKGNFLRGAMHRELGLGYDSSSIERVDRLLLNNSSRHFRFSSQEALDNIGFDRYSIDELRNLERSIDFDSLALAIKKNGKWRKEIVNDDHEIMAMYAHALYNRGILTGENSCWGGALRYESPEDLAELKAHLEQNRRIDTRHD